MDAKIQLSKVTSSFLETKQQSFSTFGELFSGFEKCNSDYQVAWLDLSGRSVVFKRGILSSGVFLLDGRYQIHGESKLSLKFFFPNGLINRFSICVFNLLYYFKNMWFSKNKQHYDAFFYPLDALGNWYKVHGKNGFLQTQMLIPKKKCLEGYAKVFECIAKSKDRPVLSVFKKHGKQNENFLSFPMSGYSLALDFSHTKTSRKIIHDISKIVHDLDGRFYMTKDSVLGGEDLLKNYPNFQKLRTYLTNTKAFHSLQSKRWRVFDK